MSNDELLTDDYVADLLAKEAADHSLRYSSIGMDSFRTDKKPANMPKPNTRFLQRIIKSTNTHNANLLATEAAESQARLKQLEVAEERQRRRHGVPSDIRRRQMGDIKAILGGRSSGARSGSSKTAETAGATGSSTSKSRRSDGNDSPSTNQDRRERRKREETSDRDGTSRRGTKDSRRRSRSPDTRERKRRHRSRSRSRSPRADGDTPHRSSRTDKSRRRHHEEDGSSSRRHRHYRDRSRHSDEGRDSQRSHRTQSDRSEKHRRRDAGGGSDSDPLDEIIGPAPPPPVRMRGRGFQGQSSGIEKRFDPDYDPKADVDLGDSADNWDDAVEAFRDRKKYEQAQEQRMREAGFGDEAIKKWKKGGQENEEDVRWAKAGEEREWDRGKDDEPKGLLSFSD